MQRPDAIKGALLPALLTAALRIGYFSQSFNLPVTLSRHGEVRQMSSQHGRGATTELPHDLFITDELARRPSQRYSAEVEIAAMRLIAIRMANSPQDLLPAFVRLAMDVTDADASGLALVDGQDPQFLVWKHLCGSMAQFEDKVSPRYRLTGAAHQSEQPVLIAHPERVYTWAAEAGLSFPEALAVPLQVSGADVGTLWVGSAAAHHFDAGDALLLTELSRFVGLALEINRREAGLRQSLEQQQIVASEMSHRLKNVFAVADGMIRATAKNAATPDSMADVLTGRLHALEKSHALLRVNASEPNNQSASADLRQLLEEITAPHGPTDGPPAFVFEGANIICGEHATNGVALVVHELATNAVKYGALSRPGGEVRLRWRLQGDQLVVKWTETGGPQTRAPASRGLGSSLVERTISTQFGGSSKWHWRRTGLVLEMRLTMSRVQV